MRPALHFTDQRSYDVAFPYGPPEAYPELGDFAQPLCPGNGIYGGVRELLRALGYDAGRFGTAEWSPLSDLAPAGGRIVLKPNYVRHYSENPHGSLDSVVTQSAVLRPLIDYALKAVGPEGEVIVADAPQYDCDVDVLLAELRLPELLDWFLETSGREVAWRDLRVEFGRHEHGVVIERRELAGDPEGYQVVDLGAASEFTDLPDARILSLRGADYDEEVTIRHHRDGRNEYLVSRTILDADLVINVPKLKTHKKSGVTLSMKNLIGINGDKNWLPHYQTGFAGRGGDEFPRASAWARFRHLGERIARRLLRRGVGGPVFRRIRAAENAAGLGELTRAGNWHGNDTIWRTILDLNKILYLGDRRGALGEPARRVLNVYDGIVAGEGNGPMGPDERPIGLLAAGEDPGAADVALAWIMGFDWRRIPLLSRSVQELAGGVRITGFAGDPETLELWWSDAEGCRLRRLAEIDLDLGFVAHPGWRGRIERSADGTEDGALACAS